MYRIDVYTDVGSFNSAMADQLPTGAQLQIERGYRIQQIILSPYPDLPHGVAVLWKKAEP